MRSALGFMALPAIKGKAGRTPVVQVLDSILHLGDDILVSAQAVRRWTSPNG